MIQRWRVVVLALGALAAVVVAIVVVIESTSGSSSASGDTGKAASASAATVRRRNLVASDTESGTLGYAAAQTVYDRLSGTITRLAPVGRVIRPGQPLYEVDDRPVVLFNGSTPAFRDLGPSVSPGPDVLELNRDLRRLGFDPEHLITIDDIWQTATTDAVDLWQESLGETATGMIALGRVVFLPGAQRITGVDTVLGSTGQSAGGSSGSGSSGASTTAIPRPEFVATAPRSSNGASSGDSAAILSALRALLRAEAAQLKRERKSSSSSASKGSGGDAPAQAILQTASTRLVVSVPLDASKKSEAVLGERVTVELPDGTTSKGRVTEVSPVAQSSTSASNSGPGGSGSSGASSATILVTVALTGHHSSLAGLDQATVSVNFVQQRARHVLSVPVTALLATAGGGYTVQEAAAPHRLLAVTPGLFAAGYVQISGAGIHRGLRVTDSQG
ncbi:MAG TPA: peptidoglycan-binding domain-containing protein [Solirubrobacteraceae bacterium]|nr:peptidoglycan-binding domain-containing protein [Solirubrobacteraceae bacterium]